MYREYYFFSLEEYQQETDNRRICAMALNDWGCCHAGAKPPSYFGEAMVIAGEKLGILATGDNLMAYAKSL